MFRMQLAQQRAEQAEESMRKTRDNAKLCDQLIDALQTTSPVTLMVTDEFLNALGMNDAARMILAKQIYQDFERMRVITEFRNSIVNKMITAEYTDTSLNLVTLIKPWFATLKNMLMGDAQDHYQIILAGFNQLGDMLKLPSVTFNDVNDKEINKDTLDVDEADEFLETLQNDGENKPSLVRAAYQLIADAPSTNAYQLTEEFAKLSYHSSPEYACELFQALSDLGLKIENEEEAGLRLSK